jgi:cytochrome c553
MFRNSIRDMNRYTLPILGIACLLSGLAVAQVHRPAPAASRASASASATRLAETATRPGDPVQGQAKADAERCIECHGALGQGAGHSSGAEGQFPRLAGQHPRYLLKQLADFRSGRRPHDVMAIMASSVDVDDLRDIVAFFASRPRHGGDGSGGRPHAQSLFLYGDAARGLAACAACHGAARRSVTPAPRPRPRYPRWQGRNISTWNVNSLPGAAAGAAMGPMAP